MTFEEIRELFSTLGQSGTNNEDSLSSLVRLLSLLSTSKQSDILLQQISLEVLNPLYRQLESDEEGRLLFFGGKAGENFNLEGCRRRALVCLVLLIGVTRESLSLYCSLTGMDPANGIVLLNLNRTMQRAFGKQLLSI